MKIKILLCLFILGMLAPSASLALVRISNMNDFSFGTWSGSGDMILTDNICIYDNAGGVARYRITIRGSGAASAFTLAGTSTTLAYQVAFAGSDNVFTTMTSGVRIQFQLAHKTSTTCAGGTNASIRITLLQANLLAAEASSYSGTLTVLLQP